MHERGIIVYKILVGKREVRTPSERPRRRWEDNIKLDLIEVGCDDDWIHSAQDKVWWRFLVNVVMNLQIP
jgi:hypothetical protein